jgi:formate hydrogenlyase subunit 6/NADH:ubiquinone oxidoreductase subunit I
MRDCPSNAITITKVGEKQFNCEINLAKCIYCAQCVDSCPKKALEATKEFELAVLDVKKLKVVYYGAEPAKDTEGNPK